MHQYSERSLKVRRRHCQVKHCKFSCFHQVQTMRVALTNLVHGRAMLRGAKVAVVTKPRTDTVSVDTHVQLLSTWKTEAGERKIAHTLLSKQLGDLHTKLMTPQLILSAATSTLAANNLQTPTGAPIATLTVIIAIICTVLHPC